MRRLVALAATASLAVVVLPASASPLASASDQLQLSRDGVSWTPEFDGTLFDDDTAVAPGGSSTATFYVRNASGDSADLSVVATQANTGLPAEQLTIVVAVGDGPTARSSSRTFAAIAHSPGFDVDQRLPAGGSRRVDVTLRLDRDAGNETQRQAVSFRLEVRMRGETAVVPGTPGPPTPGRRPLPAMGTAVVGTLVFAAIFLVAGLGMRRAVRPR